MQQGGAGVNGGTAARTCPSCGRAIGRDWRHCVFCGTTLDVGCPQCGAPRLHVAGEAFCHRCGASLRVQPESPTVPLPGTEPDR